MTDMIMNILQWAIPSGGIGAAIAWIANRKVKEAEQAKRIHDTFKEMYGDVSKELLAKQKELNDAAEDNAKAIGELNRENARTRHALNRLTRAIEAIQLCPHRATCPVSGDLRDQEDGDGDKRGVGNGDKKRQHKKREAGTPAVVDGSGEGGHGEAGDSA